MDVLEMDDDTFIDKNLTTERLVNQAFTDTDTPPQPAERKRILPFDLVTFRRIKQPSRCVTVCFGLLCAVLLTGNIAQFICHASRPVDNSHDASIAERKELEARLTNLTKENKQLQQNYYTANIIKNHLQTSYNSLQNDKVQLQISYITLQKDTEALHSNYIALARGCIAIAQQLNNKMLRTAVQMRSMPCQTGWRKFSDSCYIVSTVKKNWTSSSDACNAVGADLVVINSKVEQAFVNGLLATGQNAWIGLTDSLKEGTWTWVDGTPVTTTYWGEDQPNSYDGNQDCGETVQKSSGVGEWNDDGCSAVQTFICEQ